MSANTPENRFPLSGKSPFFISLTSKSELINLEVVAIEKTLNQRLKLQNYGQLKQLGLSIVIATKPSQQIINRWTYQVDTKSIQIQICPPLQMFQHADSTTRLQLIASYYTAAIAISVQLHTEVFNSLLFLKDITILFKNKGWIREGMISLDDPPIYIRWIYPFDDGPQFFFSKIVHPDVVHYIESTALAHLLESNIELATYGSGLRAIYFTFIADAPEEDQIEGTLIKYEAEEKYLKISLPLSYPSLLLMNKQYNRSLLALLFLTSLKFYAQVGLHDFDVEAFERDVKALFWAEGWLEEK